MKSYYFPDVLASISNLGFMKFLYEEFGVNAVCTESFHLSGYPYMIYNSVREDIFTTIYFKNWFKADKSQLKFPRT